MRHLFKVFKFIIRPFYQFDYKDGEYNSGFDSGFNIGFVYGCCWTISIMIILFITILNPCK